MIGPKSIRKDECKNNLWSHKESWRIRTNKELNINYEGQAL